MDESEWEAPETEADYGMGGGSGIALGGGSETHDSKQRWWSWFGIVVTAFAVLFVLAAVAIGVYGLMGGVTIDDGGVTSRSDAIFAVVWGVLSTGGVLVIMYSWGWFAQAARWGARGARTIATVAAFTVALTVAAVIKGLAASDASTEVVVDVWAFVALGAAGFAEEPVFAVLPVLVAWKYGRGLLVPLIVVSALLRGGLHLYQGVVPALVAVGWGAVAAAVFAAAGSLAALIAVHVLHNIVVGAMSASLAWVWLWVAVMAVSVVWSLLYRDKVIAAASANSAFTDQFWSVRPGSKVRV